MNAKEEIIDWLRDAYAMERGLESTLKKQANNNDLEPMVRDRAAVHLEETRRHGDLVKACLEELGADTSAVKTGLGVVAEVTKGLGTSLARDEKVKDLLTAYSMEHFEIACYRALETAAEGAGFPRIAQVCGDIIEDEERMAESLAEALPVVVSSYLSGDRVMARA